MTLRIVPLALSFVSGIVLATVCRLPLWSPALLTVAAGGLSVSIGLFVRERRYEEWSRTVIVAAALA